MTDARTTGTSALSRLLQQVARYYTSEVEWEPFLQREQAEGFLRHLAASGADDETLENAWESLRFFGWYLDHLDREIGGLHDVQPYHLSELVTDFTDRKVLGRIGIAERIAMARLVRDFYVYLASTGQVTPATAGQVAAAYAVMTSQPGQLTRIERPEPRGGETFSAALVHGVEVLYTYNDYWTVLVCLRDYEGRWQEMRTAAQTVIDGQTKIDLIDHLQALEARKVEGLRNLLALRQPAPAEVQRARRFFRQDRVDTSRAW